MITRAQIELRWWSCVKGTPGDLRWPDGIRVVSNRDAPTQAKMYLDFCNCGTYLMNDRGDLIPLQERPSGSGQFYEFVIRDIFAGSGRQDKGGPCPQLPGWTAASLGVRLSEKLPEGVHQFAEILKKGLEDGVLDPFRRRITAQDGTVKSDGTRGFAPGGLLHMDYWRQHCGAASPPLIRNPADLPADGGSAGPE